jgi:hypothetical protein
MESVTHRLGWCDPASAHFWERETPNHAVCPETLGSIICACPHHQGIAPDQVDRDDAELAADRELRRKQSLEALLKPKPVKPKKKRVLRRVPA